ncbi:MAG TPA: PKD domain-containing protein [Solirubrobacterales bacterium]|nr:PKD domain-containing protein [Solirubrobacterales bacterium]
MSAEVRPLPALLGALAIAVLCFLAGPSRSGAADPAVFDVGAAVKSINPDAPQYIGGYGYKDGPTMKVHDNLEARAFVVGKGDKANVFVVVDSAGWFAAYDYENAPYGVDATRQRIADALNAQGYKITRANVIISTTHVHAAPTVVGIWGTVDGDYLKKLSDQTVAAATEAASNVKPSEIWTGVGNLRSFIWQNGQGTNHPDGFPYDNEVPVMWARDPKTGATNAVYASVPNHPDQFNGGDNDELSADWPGYARKALDELNGGTTVIGPGTLGRQEPPGSVNTYDEVIPQGKIVANEIQRTLAKATPLTDATIAASEQKIETLADNEMLLTGISYHLLAEGICLDSEEFCTLPRSKEPPYLTAGPNEDTKMIGAYVGTARIGDVVYATNPGEAFAEVNFAIRAGISGARHVNTMSQSGDMLGYYYERSDYTDQQFGSSNFETYNVGPDLPADNVAAALAGASAIGFSTTPQVVHAPFNADVADRPGVQWYPDTLESADPVVNLYGSSAKSQDGSVPAPTAIDWNFGDGSVATTTNQDRFDHTFPGPGTYEVKATVTGSNSKTRSWEQQIVVNPALQGKATLVSRAWDGATLEAGLTGGSGKLVSAHWTCQDGTRLSGLKVVCESSAAGTATVKVADGAGNTAEASVAVSVAPPKPAPRLKIVKVKLKKTKVKRGKSTVLVVKVKNTGTADTTRVRVCAKVPRKAKKGIKVTPSCKSLGVLSPGKAATAPIKVRTTRKARSKAKLRVVVSARGTGSMKRSVTIRTS